MVRGRGKTHLEIAWIWSLEERSPFFCVVDFLAIGSYWLTQLLDRYVRSEGPGKVREVGGWRKGNERREETELAKPGHWTCIGYRTSKWEGSWWQNVDIKRESLITISGYTSDKLGHCNKVFFLIFVPSAFLLLDKVTFFISLVVCDATTLLYQNVEEKQQLNSTLHLRSNFAF